MSGKATLARCPSVSPWRQFRLFGCLRLTTQASFWFSLNAVSRAYWREGERIVKGLRRAECPDGVDLEHELTSFWRSN
jgi:hypothetical protein